MKTIREMIMTHRASLSVAALLVLSLAMVWPHGAVARDEMPAGSEMNSMPGMDMTPTMTQGSPPAMRDPRANADGYDFGPIPRPHFADEHSFASLLVDRLEGVHTSDNDFTAYDLQAWYGRDYDRAVFKAEGEVDNAKIQDGRAELLWGHAVTPFWDTQIGVRHDHGVGPERSWLALGFQGLAPYWFDITATAYVGDENRTALRLDGEYDLLLSQRLILQPRLEMDFYGKDDAARTVGSGLSDLALGVRMRYEFRREFAPYVGVEWAGKYGGTADFARSAGDATEETRLVAGMRFWF